MARSPFAFQTAKNMAYEPLGMPRARAAPSLQPLAPKPAANPYGGQARRNTTGWPEAQGLGPALPYDNPYDPYDQPEPPAAPDPPDYGFNLENDPFYKLLQGQVNTANTAAGATATGGFGRAFGDYGEIPDFAQTATQLGLDPSNPLYALLMSAANNPNTRQSAQDLTNRELSTVGQYNRQLRYGTGDLYDLMGQRNTLRSGATGVGLGNLQYEDAARRYSGAKSLIDHLIGIVSSYNTTQQQGVASLQQGAQQAALRQMALSGKVPAGVLEALNMGGA